jgi:hypothetical protein
MIRRNAHIEPKEGVNEIVLDDAGGGIARDLGVVDVDMVKNVEGLEPVPAAVGTWGPEGSVVVLAHATLEALALGLPDVQDRCVGKPPSC